jgi:hypothetical protein
MALDAAARGLYVTQYIEYDGQLPVKALQHGLSRYAPSLDSSTGMLNGGTADL